MLLFGFGLCKERLLVVLLSWCTEMRSDEVIRVEAALSSLLSAGVAEQWGMDCKQKVTGEQMDPLKSDCSVTRENQLFLGYQKMPGFFLAHSILPNPCPGKQDSRGAAPHCAASWCAPSSPDLADREAWLSLEMHPVVVPGWVQSRGQCCPWSSEEQPRCLCRGWHLSGTCIRLETQGHLQERDWVRRLRLRQPWLAPATEHLACSTHPSRHGKHPQLRKREQKRSFFD